MKTWTASDALRPPVITKKTNIFQYTKHKLVWEWLVEHPDKGKREAFEALGLKKDRLFCLCYACDYVRRLCSKQERECDEVCPLDFTEQAFLIIGQTEQECLGGLMGRWKYAHLYCFETVKPRREKLIRQYKHELAKVIANLPVKEGIPWE